MTTLEFSKTVSAPTNLVREVISDVEAYADVAPNLSRAAIESGEGAGMVRRCWDTQGGSWRETCSAWLPGREYRMVVDTSDYPYPFTAMAGRWSVEPDGDGSRIRMLFDYRLPYGPLGSLLGRTLVARKFRPVAENLLDNWAGMIEERLAKVGTTPGQRSR